MILLDLHSYESHDGRPIALACATVEGDSIWTRGCLTVEVERGGDGRWIVRCDLGIPLKAIDVWQRWHWWSHAKRHADRDDAAREPAEFWPVALDYLTRAAAGETVELPSARMAARCAADLEAAGKNYWRDFQDRDEWIAAHHWREFTEAP